MLSNCIFACDGVTCSAETVYSFKNIICNAHLKEVYGLKQWIFKSETESGTEFCGPYLIPDNFLSFKPNTVVFPTKDFLDAFLMPEKYNKPDTFQYELNPRMKVYYNNLNMQRMKFAKNPKTMRYHFELIRNLPVKDAKDIKNINDHDMAHIDLKKHLQDRITSMNHWIESEPYYKNFEKMQVLKINQPEMALPLDQLSPFYGFLLFNTIFDKHYLPIHADTAPLMCYANLAYKDKVGFVTINEIKNNVPLVTLGTMKASVAYYQQKTHVEPNQVVANHFNKDVFPDKMRNLNVISSNERYC